MNKPAQNSHGVALVELALGISLIVLLIFAAFSYSEYIRSEYDTRVIARNAAKTAFHACLDNPLAAAPNQAAGMSACLQSVANDIFQQGRAQVSDLKVLLSYYAGTTGGTVVQVNTVLASSAVAASQSRFTRALVDSTYASTLSATGGIIVAEVYGVAPPVSRMFISTLSTNGVFYAAAIS